MLEWLVEQAHREAKKVRFASVHLQKIDVIGTQEWRGKAWWFQTREDGGGTCLGEKLDLRR